MKADLKTNLKFPSRFSEAGNKELEAQIQQKCSLQNKQTKAERADKDAAKTLPTAL